MRSLLIKYWPVLAAYGIFIVAAILILGTPPSANERTAKGASGVVQYSVTLPGGRGNRTEYYYWSEGGKLQAMYLGRDAAFVLTPEANYLIDYRYGRVSKTRPQSNFLQSRAASTDLYLWSNPIGGHERIGESKVAGVACETYKTSWGDVCVVDGVVLRQTMTFGDGKYQKIATRVAMDAPVDPALFTPPAVMPMIQFGGQGSAAEAAAAFDHQAVGFIGEIF